MRFSRPPKRATGRRRPIFSSRCQRASGMTAACAGAGGRRRWMLMACFVVFPPGDKYAIAFGNDIIQSIPDGSIYFGGTDPGRFVVTALMESHADGKPFFTLSQNPLRRCNLFTLSAGDVWRENPYAHGRRLAKELSRLQDRCATPSFSRSTISQRAQTTQARRRRQAGCKRTNPSERADCCDRNQRAANENHFRPKSRPRILCRGKFSARLDVSVSRTARIDHENQPAAVGGVVR